MMDNAMLSIIIQPRTLALCFMLKREMQELYSWLILPLSTTTLNCWLTHKSQETRPFKQISFSALIWQLSTPSGAALPNVHPIQLGSQDARLMTSACSCLMSTSGNLEEEPMTTLMQNGTNWMVENSPHQALGLSHTLLPMFQLCTSAPCSLPVFLPSTHSITMALPRPATFSAESNSIRTHQKNQELWSLPLPGPSSSSSCLMSSLLLMATELVLTRKALNRPTTSKYPQVTPSDHVKPT